MAYPLDTAAQNAALDVLLGRDLTGIPTAWQVALYTNHPLLGGTELTSAGGYARGSLNNNLTDYPPASAGEKTSVQVAFGTSTGAYSDTAPCAVLIDAADSTTRWFAVFLDPEVSVVAAGAVVVATLSHYWNVEA